MVCASWSFNWFPLFFYLRDSRMNFTEGERTSDRKEAFFGSSAIRLIDLPMYLTFKAILNIHPSLECGRNPITREGHKERVLFNRFNWNYFSPPSFPGREGGTRGSLGIFCNNRSFLFFLSFSLIGEKSSFTLFHSSFLSAGLNGRGFIMGY